jgi:hypothetical protein
MLLLVGIALAAVSAACSGGPPAGGWNLTAKLASGAAVPVAVRDTTGRITLAEVDPPGVGTDFANPPGQPDVVLVPWTGGNCDSRIEITIRSVDAGPGLVLDLQSTVASGACDAMAVGHVLRLTATGPVPVDRVIVQTVQP